ncbi:helix-turn-helix domain-containing protein [Paenibacillus bouchesdurhonensis]|uniref:helix-turn-helix domain-containing protein n=1 Tax=Paenibacillus bouchesdurhonensis TaxID=1870990 RepID=UPI000DA60ADA|nr:helix-turn-helix transcriptional regulator [Paenibacillus bouchesdurhonensis]
MPLKVKVTLGDLLLEKGMSFNELSVKSKVRRAAISELVNGKRENINFEHIAKIAEALGTTDISQIIMLVEDTEH